MTNHTTPRIAVIGAGPSGLTLANVLQRHGISCIVYERDASAQARPQGGTLDMKTDTGQAALRHAGLLDQFLALARPEGQDGKLLAKTGEVLFAHEADPDELAQPEIDRGQLRDLLLNGLDPDAIRWGHGLRSVQPAAHGYALTFDNGTVEPADLVVGGDGAWSRVRPLVSAARPDYTGVTFVEVRFEDVDARHPDIAELVGNGSMFALSENKGLITQRSSRGQVRVYAAFRVADGWQPGPDPRATLLTMFTGWAPELRALLTRCDDDFVVRPLHALPVPHVWDHRPGVTLLGDAAHLMSPFSGLGANLAMLDGAELGLAIADNSDLDDCDDLDAAVRAYERAMWPRSIEAAKDAAIGLSHAIAPDAPRASLEMFANQGA